MDIPEPAHPLPALTTYEPARYRRQLDQALNDLPGHTPARQVLQQRLADVITEQDSRTTSTASGQA
jgi:hypothetical protein